MILFENFIFFYKNDLLFSEKKKKSTFFPDFFNRWLYVVSSVVKMFAIASTENYFDFFFSLAGFQLMGYVSCNLLLEKLSSCLLHSIDLWFENILIILNSPLYFWTTMYFIFSVTISPSTRILNI